MFNQLNPFVQGYSQVNSYLTMVASRFTFLEIYGQVPEYEKRVETIVLVISVPIILLAALLVTLTLGITIGAVIVAGLSVVVIYSITKIITEKITRKRRNEIYHEAATEFFSSRGALSVRFIDNDGSALDPLTTGFNAVLFRTENCIVIAIRGTEMDHIDKFFTKTDMWKNTNLEMTQDELFRGVGVHKGLHQIIRHNLQQVITVIRDLADNI